MTERRIAPCTYPGCEDREGNPRLTNLGMCHLCRRRYRNVLRWLVMDWVHLRRDYPTPRHGDQVRRSTSKVYGHPAEWASDKAREIANVLNDTHDALADHLHQTPPPHPGTTERGRVGAAWTYLECRMMDLAAMPDAEVIAEEIATLHNGVRSMLGYNRPRQTLPVPCPACELLTVTRTVDPYDDRITCESCGWMIREDAYPFFTRLVLDALIDAA